MIVEAILLGALAGVVSGMLGVGGGVVFVPALVIVIGLGQVEAEATSLLAIVPVALLGTWRQYRYGNVRLRDGITVGVLAAAGAVFGVVIANAVPARALEVGFSLLMLATAVQLFGGSLRARSHRRARERG